MWRGGGAVFKVGEDGEEGCKKVFARGGVLRNRVEDGEECAGRRVGGEGGEGGEDVSFLKSESREM